MTGYNFEVIVQMNIKSRTLKPIVSIDILNEEALHADLLPISCLHRFHIFNNLISHVIK